MKMTTPIFGLLPPFYEKPPHETGYYLRRIEDEFGIPIRRHRYFKDAFDHDVFIINKELVFRFPRTERDIQHLPYEIDFLKFLAQKVKVTIPQYSYVSKRGDFAGYAIVPGKILSPQSFKALSSKKKEQVIDQLTDFVNQFHRIEIKEFSHYKPKLRDEFKPLEERVEIELENKLFPKLPPDEVQIVKRFYRESKLFFEEIPHMCPLHGDLYAYNTMWNPQTSKIGIIDFSDIQIGDPANDFEVFYDYGPESAERAYQQYTGHKDDNFLRRAEIYYKLHAIYTLLSSQLDALISFEHAHMRFKQKFALQ